ncbi:MAG TPA: ester cyclase [Syntrophorhabdaceae bacterium]|nr:ester cyclase [Syntrophorhabdaceae bacterium]
MTLEDKKNVVLAFFKTAFEDKEPEKAIELYVGDYYRQHNPGVPDGKESFAAYVKMRSAKNPGRKILLKRIIAEGDLVMLHSHNIFAPGDEGHAQAPFGVASINIFRLENGKVVEHWDVREPVPGSAVHANTMF